MSEKMERLSHKGSADDLYDSIRQSSRGPMTGRQGNKLEMKGYLYIKKNSKIVLLMRVYQHNLVCRFS
jgi:hypothetical protein